jgi:hypothetical protein
MSQEQRESMLQWQSPEVAQHWQQEAEQRVPRTPSRVLCKGGR